MDNGHIFYFYGEKMRIKWMLNAILCKFGNQFFIGKL